MLTEHRRRTVAALLFPALRKLYPFSSGMKFTVDAGQWFVEDTRARRCYWLMDDEDIETGRYKRQFRHRLNLIAEHIEEARHV